MAYIYRTRMALFQRWIFGNGSFGNGDIDTLFGHNEAQIELPLHSRPRVMIQSRQTSPNHRCQHCRPATRARSRAISALWTSLVAWSSTVLTFWFVEPEVQALQKFFRLLLYILHTARSREKPRGACLARVHIEARTGPARAHAATFRM